MIRDILERDIKINSKEFPLTNNAPIISNTAEPILNIITNFKKLSTIKSVSSFKKAINTSQAAFNTINNAYNTTVVNKRISNIIEMIKPKRIAPIPPYLSNPSFFPTRDMIIGLSNLINLMQYKI